MRFVFILGGVREWEKSGGGAVGFRAEVGFKAPNSTLQGPDAPDPATGVSPLRRNVHRAIWKRLLRVFRGTGRKNISLVYNWFTRSGLLEKIFRAVGGGFAHRSL